MSQLPQSVVDQCKDKLLQSKAEILNRLKLQRAEYHSRDTRGDETDQAMNNLAEGEFLVNQERLGRQLLDIETALARIERGQYGICEETEEPIEHERLLAIPWTTLSIEGAEIRDEVKKRFAHL